MNTDNTNPTMNSSKTIDFAINGGDKKSILNGKMALATLFGAGSALAFVSAKDLVYDDSANEVANESETDIEDCDYNASVVMNEEIIEAPSDMSFGEAFAAQRELQGAGGIFKFKEGYYNTYYKEEWDDLSESDRADYFAGIEDAIDHESSTIVDNSTGEVVHINIDSDSFPEIVLNDTDNDGIMEIDKVDLNNDGVYDVIHDQGSAVEQEVEGSGVLEMNAGFEEIDSSELPEEMEFLPTDEISEEELESFVIDEGDMIEPIEDITNEEEIFVEEGDMQEPLTEEGDFIDEGDLVDPSMTVEEGDMADPSDEVLQTEDLIEDISGVEADELPDAIDGVDLSEFDF